MVQPPAALAVGGDELPPDVPRVPRPGDGDDLHFFLCGHLGEVLQFGVVVEGSSLAERDQPVNGHVPLSPLTDKGLKDLRPLHARHFDAVMASVGEALSAPGPVVEIPSGNSRLFHHF